MEVSGQHHTPPALLLISIKYEVGFVSELAWTFWSREKKALSLARNQTPDPPGHNIKLSHMQ
jgi:hypothetical protein